MFPSFINQPGGKEKKLQLQMARVGGVLFNLMRGGKVQGRGGTLACQSRGKVVPKKGYRYEKSCGGCRW